MKRRQLLTLLRERRPDLSEPQRLIEAARVFVDGRPLTNPRSLVARDASIVVRAIRPLRGSTKLRAALSAFGIHVAGRVAVDVGAAAGGFTAVLVEHGARKVYAVDAGYGQLLGSLRTDERVVNLERTNLGELSTSLVPDAVGLITVDVSYVALANAVPQLNRLRYEPEADLVALVKPMFELHLPAAPAEAALLQEAAARAHRGVLAAGWTGVSVIESPVSGARGASEFLLHATRG
jgi:23S rRNA (cytidine1920-2'-O)/16S rRNA (cytidine1409-2'-O)-methyltransferase